MMRYEIYKLYQGKLHPTGIWSRGRHLSEVEYGLNRQIKGINLPCTILVTPYKPDPNGEIS